MDKPKKIEILSMSVTGWRLKLGVGLFALSIVLPVLGVPLVAVLGLSAKAVATISGTMLAGSEVLGIVAVAVMGKSGYAYIKNRVFGFLKQYGPPAEVSRTRYTIGLVMFAVPIAFGWLSPYAADLIPGYPGNEFTYAIVGDLLLLLSLFVLGGDFWDKLRALFINGAKAVLPETTG
ncbi:MAG: transporter suffix domain-containing protein [Proteobacteria bacterium]|nr:transporter suffix domain-containing protein [Pseudomonadota bacterium]